MHIWRAFLDDQDSDALFETLAPDERARAGRFVHDRDRRRFVAGRGILRAILALYLQCLAGEIEFAYEPEGKPRLRDNGSRRPSVRFNLSHSYDLAVYAISTDREIGIDVEAIRSDFDPGEIARRFFSAREFAELLALPAHQRNEGFFACWTRKEAYLKARGSGFGIPLDSFDVSMTPGMPEILTCTDENRWILRSFHPADGYAGAVVADGGSWKLHLWDWRNG
jgi:4'-phosphopantetheinyl transferase